MCCAKSLQSCLTLSDPMNCSPPGSSVHGIREEYWNGLLFPTPGNLPDPGIELSLLSLLHWQAGSLPPAPPGKPSSVQFSRSVMSNCDSVDCSMSGFPVDQQLLELAQTHVHQVSDAIQLSHPLSSPSPPAFNLSQHQGLFQ